MGMVLGQRMTGAVSSAPMVAVADGRQPVLGRDCAFAPDGGVPVTLLGTDAQSFRKWYRRQLAGNGSNDPDNSPPLHRALDSTVA
jgi:hypothetical protein